MRCATVKNEGRSSMRKSIAPLLGVVIFSISCATWAGKPPPCPPPSQAAVNELEALMGDGPNGSSPISALEHWIGEIERYCRGIMEMRR